MALPPTCRIHLNPEIPFCDRANFFGLAHAGNTSPQYAAAGSSKPAESC